MGGGGATANNEFTFEDTSEFTYRNSVTERGGREVSGHLQTNTTNLDIDGTEDVVKEVTALTAAERQAIRDQIATYDGVVRGTFGSERTELFTRATKAWDRACTLYADTRAELQAEFDIVRTEAINLVCLQKLQWQRTAGSSLNTSVALVQAEAEIALTEKLAGLIAERTVSLRAEETRAISQAFMDSLNARMEPGKLAMQHMSTMYNVLRGALVNDQTDRVYSEDRGETNTQLQVGGKLFHDVTDIGDQSGAKDGALNQLAGGADGAALPF